MQSLSLVLFKHTLVVRIDIIAFNKSHELVCVCCGSDCADSVGVGYVRNVWGWGA